MRTELKTFNISEKIKIELPLNIHAQNLNIKTFLKFLNYRDYKINCEYLKLLPLKIQTLKELKHDLINYKVLISQQNDSDILNELKNKLKGFQIIKDEFIKNGLDIDLNLNDAERLTLETETENAKRYYTKEQRLKSIQNLINLISDRIKFYIHAKETQQRFKDYSINAYDIEQLNKNILTQNAKESIYFYLIKLKKVHLSKLTTEYLNHDLIRTALKDYCENDIIKDFRLIAENDLNTFKHYFLNKTI